MNSERKMSKCKTELLMLAIYGFVTQVMFVVVAYCSP